MIFPNPNAPTGVLMDPAQVEEIIEANRDVAGSVLFVYNTMADR